MNKLILSALLSAGFSTGVFAQGTIALQNFSNSGGGLVYSYDGPNPSPPGFYPATGPINLEMFYGPVGSTLQQLLAGSGSGFGDVVFTYDMIAAVPGKFFYGPTVITGEPGGTGNADPTLNIELAIAGWTGNYANYEAALIGDANTGITAAWANPTGGGGSPPALPAGLIGWVNANSLFVPGLPGAPEPTTIALGGLGAAALLMFRRRK